MCVCVITTGLRAVPGVQGGGGVPNTGYRFPFHSAAAPLALRRVLTAPKRRASLSRRGGVLDFDPPISQVHPIAQPSDTLCISGEPGKTPTKTSYRIIPLPVARTPSLKIRAGYTDHRERAMCSWKISVIPLEAIPSVACATFVSRETRHGNPPQPVVISRY